jgi:uncharacterized damage-inducible protein DinB
MHTAETLIEFHERSHRSLKKLLAHCLQLDVKDLNHELNGFGYSTIRLQFHHEIGAEKYWIGVLQGRIDVDENDSDYPTIESLEAYRQQVFLASEKYLHTASIDELNTARLVMTWGGKERLLIPAHVFVRTQTHIYHHQGQIVAMCRLLGKPATGMDYPIE